MIKTYYLLTKPGIIFGNAITAIAGFALASKGNFDFVLFLQTLVGLISVIASACVFNNYIDRERDQKMERTKNRPLALGLISSNKALIFASCLGMFGISILFLYTNIIATAIAALGFFVYVALYSFWKHSEYATLVGSLAGATPPVVGYAAVSNTLDLGALLLFTILVLWQMPHFYAIAMYRIKDYQAANIPVLPITKGIHITKIHMFFYVIAFCVSCLLLPLLGYTGYSFFAVAAILGLSWLFLSFQGFQAKNDVIWAKKMFFLSLIIITALSIAIPLDVN